MKLLFSIILLFSSTFLMGQGGISYNDVLKRTREITIADSLFIDVASVEHVALDTPMLEAFFQAIYPPLGTGTKKSRPMEYFISGKITTHPNFDLLLVSTKKENDDNKYFEYVYLLTTRKDGSNISTLTIAIRREKDAVVNTSSWLFKDYRIFVATNIQSKGKTFGGLAEYRINEEGRFVHFPHWTK